MEKKDEYQSGPCIVCGEVNYPFSYGGPTICPSCDCGIDPQIKKLKTQLSLWQEQAERLEEALNGIHNFHEEGYDLDDLEKKYGFLGWTCCGQLSNLAGKALDAFREFKEKLK